MTKGKRIFLGGIVIGAFVLGDTPVWSTCTSMERVARWRAKSGYSSHVEAVPRLLIGSSSGEHVLVDSFRWEFPESTDYWDRNWVYAIRFKLAFDQTELPAMLRDLDELLRLFPVRRKP